MSLRTANLLTLGAFCTLYFGLKGILMAINVPVCSDARETGPAGPRADCVGGPCGDAVGRVAKVDDSSDGSYPPI
jgi:hypothetical protein